MKHEEFLFFITDILTKNKIPNALFAGTLLGAIREKNFLKNDTHDTDIIVPSKYFYKVKKILEDLDKENQLILYVIWRREIAVLSPKKEYKVDIFFVDTDNKISSIYDYVRNPTSKLYEIERKWNFNSKYVFPFKKSKFLKHNVFIPNNSEGVLQQHYGNDWKIPNPEWKHESSSIIDNNYREFAIIIPTFLRPEKIEKEINSILQYCQSQSYRLYIGDQSGEFSKTDMTKELVKLGHKIYNIPFNSGLSYTRNYLVQQTIEPLILVIDDDYIFNQSTNLFTFEKLLMTNEDVGLVGGLIANRGSYSHDLYLDNDKHKLYFIKDETKPFLTYTFLKGFVQEKLYKYHYCDSIMNFFLSKREVYNDVKWDNRLLLCEHTDYLLQLKNSKWKVIYTPDVNVTELDEKAINTTYAKYRNDTNSKPSLALLYKKYGLKTDDDIIRITVEKKESYTINKESDIFVKPEKTTFVNTFLINLMQNKEIWFLGQSCLEAINYNKILTNTIYLGVRNETTKLEIEQLFKQNFNDNIICDIAIDNKRKIRWSDKFRVPIPVVKYLENLYGPNWEKIKIEEKK